MQKLKLSLLSSLVILITGCNNSSHDDKELRALVDSNNLTGDPTVNRNLPSIDEPLSQLGKKLFQTKALGGDLDSACISCHHPVLGGGDNLSLSIGTESLNPDLLGDGRLHNPYGTNYDGGPTVPRNAPTTFNIGLWDSVLFWDGRVESVLSIKGKNGSLGGIMTPDSKREIDSFAGSTLPVAQARFPQTSAEEMRGHSFEEGNSNDDIRDHIASRLAQLVDQGSLVKDGWLEAFQDGFNSDETDKTKLITASNIAEALGAYERSQVFVNTPWKKYVEGDNLAITYEAKQGALLFFNSLEDGGANCASCHSGDFFTDEEFHVMGIPQIGRGKGHGDAGDDDYGRMAITQQESDKYKFRTPSLLNVEVTGPWGHSGAYTSLEGIVRHMANPIVSSTSYDSSQLGNIFPQSQLENLEFNTSSAIAQLKYNQENGLTIFKEVNLDDTQIEYIVEFLKTLTDPCVKSRECLKPWFYDANSSDELDVDGLMLRPVDINNNPI